MNERTDRQMPTVAGSPSVAAAAELVVAQLERMGIIAT
jgi:hypothetical protein